MEAVTIRRSALDHLPRLNRAVALLMEEDGLLVIVEDTGDAKQPLGATGA